MREQASGAKLWPLAKNQARTGQTEQSNWATVKAGQTFVYPAKRQSGQPGMIPNAKTSISAKQKCT